MSYGAGIRIIYPRVAAHYVRDQLKKTLQQYETKNKQQNITSLLIVLHKVVYTVHTWLIQVTTICKKFSNRLNYIYKHKIEK